MHFLPRIRTPEPLWIEGMALITMTLRVSVRAEQVSLQALITHTSEELRQALAHVKELVPPGYAEQFLAVQEEWKHSLNCWSASPSIPGRVLSNWYPIEEGIQLYGDTYDSA